MRTRTKKRMLVLGAALLVALGVVGLNKQCDRLFAQAPTQNASPEPVKALLSETEELRLVNTYQAAVLAQVDLQAAQERVRHTRDTFDSFQAGLKRVHNWAQTTTFEINGETGKVLVHLPPTVSQPPSKGTKEQ